MSCTHRQLVHDLNRMDIYAPGVFEQIAGSIHPSYHCETFDKHTKIKKSRKRFEILHIAYDCGDCGHYCGAIKDGDTVHFFDSLGPESDFAPRFVKYFRRRYGPSIRIIRDFGDVRFQPRDCGEYTLRSAKPTDHQYCYVEAFVYLEHKILGTPMGPLDTESRLEFIRDWLVSKKCRVES